MPPQCVNTLSGIRELLAAVEVGSRAQELRELLLASSQTMWVLEVLLVQFARMVHRQPARTARDDQCPRHAGLGLLRRGLRWGLAGQPMEDYRLSSQMHRTAAETGDLPRLRRLAGIGVALNRGHYLTQQNIDTGIARSRLLT